MTATARLIGGHRLHLQHGPIDLVIGADGAAAEIERAYRAAWAAFPSLLPALVEELPFLRSKVAKDALAPAPPGEREEDRKREAEGTHAVARAMYAAVWPYRDRFVTPMAAVAGSVADHVLGVMLKAAPLTRAYVNNGGDIAIHLAPGQTFVAGVVGDVANAAIDARAVIASADGIGGIATSGWRGRSQSLGIADAVTVLARDAATADAAATMIANAVDLDHPAVTRRPAREVKDDSDLGDRLVTVAVGPLDRAARGEALAAGAKRACEILIHGLMIAAYIQLQGEMMVVGGGRLSSQAA